MRDIQQSQEWFEWSMHELYRHGCNLIYIQPWHHLHGETGMRRHMRVMRGYPSFEIVPYIDHVCFPVRDPIPDPVSNMPQLVERMFDRLSPVPEARWRRRDDRRVFGMVGNFESWRHWGRDSIARWEEALGDAWGDALPAMICIDRRMTDSGFTGERLQCNLFRHPRHLHLSPPTAAVRPGYFHSRNWQDGDRRYVPRRGGKKFKLALREAIANPLVDEIAIESWNEHTEHSYIEPSDPRAVPTNVRLVPPNERWGKGPRRYLKIIRKELERHG
jgi:hypothetical protein